MRRNVTLLQAILQQNYVAVQRMYNHGRFVPNV